MEDDAFQPMTLDEILRRLKHIRDYQTESIEEQIRAISDCVQGIAADTELMIMHIEYQINERDKINGQKES